MATRTEEEMKGEIAKALDKSSEWEKASLPMNTEITRENKEDLEKLISHPKPNLETKLLKGFKTGTFLDELYLNIEGKQINGIPMGIQLGITGLPSSGKSILIEEIAVRRASEKVKVLLITSEDLWEVLGDSTRLDLQARLRQKAEILGIKWSYISEYLFVLDTVTHADLRKWHWFAKAYRYIIEKEGIELVLVDSVTLLETYRGALKYRLQELTRYNQIHGITGIFVNQKATEKADERAMAGGIGLGHILDSTLQIEYKRTYYADENAQLGTKRGTHVNYMIVRGCRLCGYDGERKHVGITHDGFLKKFELAEIQAMQAKAKEESK